MPNLEAGSRDRIARYITGLIVDAQSRGRIVANLNSQEQKILQKMNIPDVETLPCLSPVMEADTPLSPIPTVEELARDTRRSPKGIPGLADTVSWGVVAYQNVGEIFVTMSRNGWDRFIRKDRVGNTHHRRLILPPSKASMSAPTQEVLQAAA